MGCSGGTFVELTSEWGDYRLELVRDSYATDGSLAVTAYVVEPSYMAGEPYAPVTQNVGEDMAAPSTARAYLAHDMSAALRAARDGVGRATGAWAQSGFAEFEQFEFSEGALSSMRNADEFFEALRGDGKVTEELEREPEAPGDEGRVAAEREA